ncbi:SAM-dependent methyltransferase [Zoogloea sp.]|uniref:class I SAM-dependent methyltransferase n=1 Tax=Zoogloea sp. TaxID=49181 RepID=UPI002602AC4B|nr:SAM-dependent methyltransferase [Zoogloea sp.]MDD3352681.1 SAM-dependent methyltransferase [Zoogloea sp.]
MKLPQPSPEALDQSARLVARLRSLIEAENGWISFATYMAEALYAPGLGYYSGGARKFGAGGDFITAPELTPLFGQALASQMQQIMGLSAPHILEAGAGTGLLAADLLLELEHRDCLPETYSILEVSAELKERQFDTLAEKAPHLAHRVRWLDGMPEHFSGALVANEVLDVLPVHLMAWRPEGLFERGVTLGEEGFVWADQPASGRVAEAAMALGIPFPSAGEYVSELNLAGRAWIAEWAARIDRGAMLLVDYGYPRAEYYLGSRSTGTLMCYFRHHAHGDPFLWPGLNDITAFVDFTAAAEAGFEAGLDVLGYTNQASLLLNCGVLECLARRAPEDGVDYIRASKAVQRLTGPHEMGELFKVIALGKGISQPLVGFLRGDRLHTL